MSKQASKTLIGGFVLGAIALVVIGVLIFGSGRFLKERNTYVLFFDGSLKGLNVGSSVVFRGVKIGTVTDVKCYVDPKELSFSIPVFIEVEPDRFSRLGKDPGIHTPENAIELLVARGLRAQLEMQSLVTGKLMVSLDFHPDKPAKLVGLDMGYQEIPTIPTSLEEIAKRVEKIPVEEIFKKLLSAVEGIEKVVNSPDIIEAVQSFNQTMDASRNLVENIDKKVGPLASGIQATVKDTRKLVNNADSRFASLASSIDNTAKAAESVVMQAAKTLETLENTAGDDSTVLYELNNALRELASGARSIRVLADYLNRHPESLLYGKGGDK